ncbi:MAG: exodeoxyribonuclease V subunit gamma [Deltaproteobacteria bacterium]|nr:exodeoxyribonuclease V subunit gamma [Deltaproteobacteria bacterium]
MPGLRLITSSSQRRLLEALADNLLAAPPAPLESENIVVLSNGMARWISMELAVHHGVSAGLRFSFPNDMLDTCFSALLTDIPSGSPFKPDAMTWRIATLLPELAETKGFEQIAAYLRCGRDDRRLLQISGVIADLFDQYTIFRPEMVLSWDKGEADGWQPQLWRAVSAGHQGSHRAARLAEFQRRIRSERGAKGVELPDRITLFGISYLPPFHLEALRLLSEKCDVICYLLNPCGRYWGNIVSGRHLAGLSLQSGAAAEALEYYETGNPLLSSLGTLGQEFFEALLDYGFDYEELDDFQDAPAPECAGLRPSSLLSAIQNDILTLRDPLADGIKRPLPAGDRSLQLHSCHGKRREMEILYDHLLAMFDELKNLEPRQILVMIPDMESYAPYISAVFGGRSGGRPYLPYSIADRSVRGESPFIDTFLDVLELSSSRFGVNEVLGILESPLVMARFDISEDELASLRSWLHGSAVRWGLDENHRAELGFSPFADFSWQAGLDRLFLGYAMTPDASGAFKGILPYPAMGGQRSLALGKLADFFTNIRQIHSSFASGHTLLEWKNILSDAAAGMLSAEDRTDNGPALLAKALNSLGEKQTLYGFDRPLGLDAVRDSLKLTLTKGGGGYGFMGGAITFCAMLPMRSIPMRVVCLAGMNDGQFPRTSRQPGFSLMSGARRRGDRSLRDEDRYLFLEALLAAEERLYISYNGQSDRDNSNIPPSVLVAELQDYVSRSFSVEESGTAPAILKLHRLQGFSAAYFTGQDGSSLFSYDRESLEALEARRLKGVTQRAFMAAPLSPGNDLTGRIEIDRLKRFLSDPAAAFMENRLKIRPYEPAEEPEEREPFALNKLSGYALSQELVERIIAGAKQETCYEIARHSSVLPVMSAGKAAFDAVWRSCAVFADFVTEQTADPLESLEVYLKAGDSQLCGVLSKLQSKRHLRWRCATLKGKDRLSLWVDHLILNALKPDGYPRSSMMIAKDKILELPELDNAAEILTDLIELYREGMLKPLPFFPETSWEFVNKGQDAALKKWRGQPAFGSPGEASRAATAFCHGDSDPLDDEFRQLASRIYTPFIGIARETERA